MDHIARGAQREENIKYKDIIKKQKPQIQAKQVVKIRPKVGRGRAGIRCKKPSLLLPQLQL